MATLRQKRALEKMVEKLKEFKINNKDLPNYCLWIFVFLSVLLIFYLDSISTNFLLSFFSFFKNADPSLIAITIAVFGWIIAILLQNFNIKQTLKTEIKYDIYKQLVILHKENQDLLAKLIAKTSPPFILMESSMISFNLGLKKEFKGEWIPYTEMECVFEGKQKWNLFYNELLNMKFAFLDKYLGILYVFGDWMAPIKNLRKEKNILVEEIDVKQKNIDRNINELQTLSNEYDWRKWDKEAIKKVMNFIQNDAQDIALYLSDFMVLVHNELLSNYFNYERPTRKTFDEKYKVLTKNGMIVNLETDPKKLDAYYKLMKEINGNK